MSRLDSGCSKELGQNSQSLFMCNANSNSIPFPTKAELGNGIEVEDNYYNPPAMLSLEPTINFMDLRMLTAYYTPKHYQCTKIVDPIESPPTSSTFYSPSHISQMLPMHNLKIIARNIYSIMQNGRFISPKNISTELLERISLHDFDNQQLNIVCEPKQMPNSIYVSAQMKNVRRRLYDAINVMVAANVIQRQGFKLGIPKRKQKSTLYKTQPEYSQLTISIDILSSRIKCKRQHCQKLKQKYALTSKHINHNRNKKLYNDQIKLVCPFLLCLVPMESILQLSKAQIKIKTKSLCTPYSDMDLLSYLHLTDKSQLQQSIQSCNKSPYLQPSKQSHRKIEGNIKIQTNAFKYQNNSYL